MVIYGEVKELLYITCISGVMSIYVDLPYAYSAITCATVLTATIANPMARNTIKGALLKFFPISEFARSSSIEDRLAPMSAIAPSNHTNAFKPKDIIATATANCISFPNPDASRIRNSIATVAAV